MANTLASLRNQSMASNYLKDSDLKAIRESYREIAADIFPSPTDEDRANWTAFVDAVQESGIFDKKCIDEINSWAEPKLRGYASFRFMNRWCAYRLTWWKIVRHYRRNQFTSRAILRADKGRKRNALGLTFS